MDLQLIRTTAPLTLGGLFYGLIAFAAISFAIGVAHAWVYNALHKLGGAEEVLK